MKFQKADQVRDIIGRMRTSDIQEHSFNRSKIDALFEGFPPFDDNELAVNHLDTNVNFLEAPGLAHKARSTWNNAFLKPGNFFTVTLDSGPKHKRSSWSHTITKRMNRCMKQSLPYVETIRATGAQVVLHGIGPVMWDRAKCWRPDEIGIEDLLVPSGTRVKLNNLSYFGVYRRYTPEELFRMTHGKQVDPGWNMTVVNKELDRLSKELGQAQQLSYQDFVNPEKLIKLYKANSGFLDSDAVPSDGVWDFFYQDEEDTQQRWYRKMILDDTTYQDDGFLYESKRPFAGDLSQILHLQFGDGANVAPFLYHTVRSLGFLLFGVCHLQNRLRCNFMDAIFRATHEYFRVENSEDRARLQKVDLVNLGLVPSGLEFVPKDQRWQVDEALILAGLSQNRQLMSENAAAFVQDVDNGSSKELTATEVMARLNNANALVSSLLSMAYTYQQFQYREIARRFTQKDSGDKDIEAFRLGCIKDGVPVEYLNIERWDIEPERVMGGGNKTLELAQAKSMMEIATQMDSPAQREVLRDYILAVTDDPDKADRWAPEDRTQVSSSEHDAQLAFGALMQGGAVGIRMGIDHIGYVEALLLSIKTAVDAIRTIGKPEPMQLIGLMSCFKHVQDHVKIIGQNEQNQQLVKNYGDFLKPIMNQVKIWSQQLKAQDQAQQEQNGDGAKNAAILMTATTKNKIAELTAIKKEQRNDAKFVGDQKRKNLQAMTEVQRKSLMTDAEVEAKDKLTAAELRKKKTSEAVTTE